MKKIFGIQAEFNITADEDIVKGIGGGIKNGSVVVADIINALKPAIVEGIEKAIGKKDAPPKGCDATEAEKNKAR